MTTRLEPAPATAEPPAPGERAFALQIVVVGDEAELHLLGRRVRLGKVES